MANGRMEVDDDPVSSAASASSSVTASSTSSFDHPLFDDAVSEEDVRPQAAISKYTTIIHESDATGALAKVKEESIVRLARLYTRLGMSTEFKQLLIAVRPFFSTIPKSRTAKIVRSLIDVVGESAAAAATSTSTSTSSSSSSSASTSTSSSTSSTRATLLLQREVCEDAIAWCIAEKRTFLKQRIQTRLAGVLNALELYNDSIALLQRLVKEVKRFDDKLLLVEIFLLESRAQLALSNVPKSKGALTAARSSANAIYCPPTLQAEIDLQAGILCAAEQDSKTAFSYFYEAYEGFNTIRDAPHAVQSLKYMIVAKIVLNQYEDVYAIIQGKAGVKYAGIEIEAMRAVTDAYKARSIHRFEAVFTTYAAQLAHDVVINAHLSELKDQLLEQNLLRLIEPYSRVQIAHLAKLIRLSPPAVESKLSEMILDQKLHGILDQGTGDLILFDEQGANPAYTAALGTITEMSSAVDQLFDKARVLSSVV